MKTFSIATALVLVTFLSGFVPDVNPELTKGIKRPTARARTSQQMLASLSDSYYSTGFHTYTDRTIDTHTGYTCTGGGSNAVNFTFYVAAVPNRFTIYDSSNNLLYSSGWHGDANYYGPWGSSIHNANTFYWSYDGSAGQYLTLRVDTVVDTAPDHLNDYWEVDF